MMKKAVFPGSFDPITLGHVDLIYRGLEIFDEIIIAIGVNADKKQLFPLEDKIQQIKNTFINEPRIKVASYKGLTVDFCKSVNSKYILRGLRNSSDFNYEQSIAQTNSSLCILLFTMRSKSETGPPSLALLRTRRGRQKRTRGARTSCCGGD